MTVTQIRDASIFVKTRAGHETPIGRSLLAHLSDEKITAYRGPLPQEFALEIVYWRVNKGDI